MTEQQPFSSSEAALVSADALVWQTCLKAVQPPPRMSVDEWAEKHRVLVSESSEEIGPWRTDRTPYLREPMRSLSPADPTELVACLFPSQVGKTELGLNLLGFIIHLRPGPVLWVTDSENQVKRTSEQRIEPMIRACEALQERMASNVTHGKGVRIESKKFQGGILNLCGPTNPGKLASMPVSTLIVDETDRDTYFQNSEGNVIELAKKRTDTFRRRKILIISSPGKTGRSNIEDYVLQGDDRRYLVPCPECGARQEMIFDEAFSPDAEDSDNAPLHGRLHWEEGKPETVKYECGACKALIPESKKTWMLQRGEWTPTKTPSEPLYRSYRLNGLYTPAGWRPGWEEIVRKFLAVQDKPRDLETFINTVLAITYSDKSATSDPERLWERREEYPLGQVPEGAYVLTAGVDLQHGRIDGTQQERLEYQVIGWGPNLESWVVDYGVIPGDLDTRAPWAELERKVVNRRYPHALGGEIPVERVAVDSGTKSQTVYRWVATQNSRRVIAVKGASRPQNVIIPKKPSVVDILGEGRRVIRKLPLYIVDVSALKVETYECLDKPLPNSDNPVSYGACHFSTELDLEYFKGITAEILILETNKYGYSREVWKLITGRRNEPLDTRNYARACHEHLGVSNFNEATWDRYRQNCATKKEVPKEQKPLIPSVIKVNNPWS